MSEPQTIEFALIKIGDGATPTEVFTAICGITTTGLNRVAQTTDRYVRDCQAPATPPNRRVKVTGRSWTVSGNGYYNQAQQSIIEAAIGLKKNYKLVALDDDGTTELGTWSGAGVMTSANLGTTENDLGTISLTIESDGAWTYADAP